MIIQPFLDVNLHIRFRIRRTSGLCLAFHTIILVALSTVIVITSSKRLVVFLTLFVIIGPLFPPGFPNWLGLDVSASCLK